MHYFVTSSSNVTLIFCKFISLPITTSQKHSWKVVYSWMKHFLLVECQMLLVQRMKWKLFNPEQRLCRKITGKRNFSSTHVACTCSEKPQTWTHEDAKREHKHTTTVHTSSKMPWRTPWPPSSTRQQDSWRCYQCPRWRWLRCVSLSGPRRHPPLTP